MGDLEARIAEVHDQLATDDDPVLITRNGKACAVLQDIRSFERTHETLAVLKLLALGQREVDSWDADPSPRRDRSAEGKIRRERKMTSGVMAVPSGTASWGSTRKRRTASVRQESGLAAARPLIGRSAAVSCFPEPAADLRCRLTLP
jgi:prevent-host-death family protein